MRVLWNQLPPRLSHTLNKEPHLFSSKLTDLNTQTLTDTVKFGLTTADLEDREDWWCSQPYWVDTLADVPENPKEFIHTLHFKLPGDPPAGGDHLTQDIFQAVHSRQTAITNNDPAVPSLNDLASELIKFVDDYYFNRGAMEAQNFYVKRQPFTKASKIFGLKWNECLHVIWDIRASEAKKLWQDSQFKKRLNAVLKHLENTVSDKGLNRLTLSDIQNIWVSLAVKGTTVTIKDEDLEALDYIADDDESSFIVLTHPSRAVMLSGQLTTILSQLEIPRHNRKVASVVNYRFLECFPPIIREYLKAAGFTGVDAWAYFSQRRPNPVLKHDLDAASEDFIQNRSHLIIYPEHTEGIVRTDDSSNLSKSFNPATANLVYQALLKKNHVKIVPIHANTPPEDSGVMNTEIHKVGIPLYLIRDAETGQVSYGHGYSLMDIEAKPLQLWLIDDSGIQNRPLICHTSNTAEEKEQAVRAIAWQIGFSLSCAFYGRTERSVLEESFWMR